ncbi:MAG: hypothetical protein ACK56G_20635 [Pirellulaceae bacterium]
MTSSDAPKAAVGCCRRPNRRNWVRQLGGGLAPIALASMLHRDATASSGSESLAAGPHFAPRAKSVIWLFMNGGVSHM